MKKKIFKEKKIYLIKISLIIFTLLFLEMKLIKSIIQKFLKINYQRNIKVCLCTPGKNENLYIREFINHYINYGVDKIFIYDNNDINGEHFEEVLIDYIKDGLVKINNWRGIKKAALSIMNSCYQLNYNIYDWLIFYEIDEYIYLKNYNNIKPFLNEPKFQNCKIIQLNWVQYTDNNLIYYQNKSIVKRFTEKEKKAKDNIKNSKIHIKSIIRGHIPNIVINCIHRLTVKIQGCDGFGRRSKLRYRETIRPDYEYYYIKHYYSKSLEEFIEKINRGDIFFGLNRHQKLGKIKKYFKINKITLEKIDYIENKTGLNLKKYRKKLKRLKRIKN